MQKVEDSMLELESQRFRITEYMTQTNQTNERHTSTLCYCFSCHSLMNLNWLVMAKLQKNLSMSISGITVPWNIIMKVCKKCSKHKQRCEELMKLERRKKCKDEVVEEEGVKLVGEAVHDVHDMDYDTMSFRAHCHAQ